MIVTVTMNPAIDKTVDVDQFAVGTLNRIQSSVLDAGGKGINVSKTIQAIGGESIATGFVGGNAGKTIENVLQQLGIKTDFVQVDGETRTNTKVFAKNTGVTELNEKGAVIHKEQLDALFDKIMSYAGRDTLFVLAGSIPEGVPKDTYKVIIQMVHRVGSKVLLDADGELFRQSLPACPDIIKPNREELAEYAGVSGAFTQEALLAAARKFLADGIQMVVVSMGGDGAMFLTQEEAYQCPGLKVKAHSTVGAGDAMVAGLAHSVDSKYNMLEMMKLCVATSAGAVTTVGTKPPSLAVIEELKPQVVMNKIGE
ncbi:MAG: 1-phosphofructokinase [Faecalibacterium sp.]